MKISNLLRERLSAAAKTLALLLQHPYEMEAGDFHELLIIHDEFIKLKNRLLEKK